MGGQKKKKKKSALSVLHFTCAKDKIQIKTKTVKEPKKCHNTISTIR